MDEKLRKGPFPGTSFHCSGNGWVTQELYYKWFQFFLANIPPVQPVALIKDGHSSHIFVEVIELAKSNDVHLLYLPPHTTHILQPLDVGVFKSLKSFYSKECRKYVNDRPGTVITTGIISMLIEKAWPKSVTPLNIMAGFWKTGAYPLNPGEISDCELKPSEVLIQPRVPSEEIPSKLLPIVILLHPTASHRRRKSSTILVIS